MVRIPSATTPAEPALAPGSAPEPLPHESTNEERSATGTVLQADSADRAIASAAPQAPPAAASPSALVGSPPADGSTATPAPQDGAAPSDDTRHPFRVVITCKPAGKQSWIAGIAVGQIGAPGQPAPVDPLFQTLEDAGLADALAAVEPLYESALARWAEQPRHARAPLATPARREPSANQQAKIAAALQHREERAAAKGAKQSRSSAPSSPAPPPPAIGEKLPLF